MFSISRSLERFKGEWRDRIDPDLVEQACREADYTWRDRLLNPLTTLQLFLLQILHGNTPCSHLRHLSGLDIAPSSYCEARMRLPLEVFRRVIRGMTAPLCDAAAELWHGHRVWVMDGSSVSMPDTKPLQERFGQPSGQKPGCGFPVASLLVLFNAATGLLVDVLVRPWDRSEMSGLTALHPHLQANDLLLGDRGLGSYVHVALLLGRGLHGLFRLRAGQNVSFNAKITAKRLGNRRPGEPTYRLVQKLGRFDQVVELFKPARMGPHWLSATEFRALPNSIQVRLLRYWVKRPGFRTRRVDLVTTLLDPIQYPAEALAELYGQRWEVETNLGYLKTAMGMDVLHCKCPDGVLKEILMFLLVYNMVRIVMLEAGRRQSLPTRRISFIDAYRWLASHRPGSSLPVLIQNPPRPGRYEPRAVKRRPKQYDLLNRPRAEMRKSLREQQLAV